MNIPTFPTPYPSDEELKEWTDEAKEIIKKQREEENTIDCCNVCGDNLIFEEDYRRCESCGRLVCPYCIHYYRGIYICEDCLEEELEGE